MAKVIQLFGPRGEDVFHDTFMDFYEKIQERKATNIRSMVEALAERNSLLQDAPYVAPTSPILDARGRPYLKIIKE